MSLIHIQNWPHPVEAGRQRILEAALDAGVPFPHGCGSGECGSCKSRLLDGQVSCDPHSDEALTPEEAADGLILACRARPVTDVRVQWLSRAQPKPLVKVIGTVARVERVASDVVTVKIDLPQGERLDFLPGQFAKVRFGRLPVRSYSFANQPREDHVVFHVREVPDGQVSRFVGQQLQTGAPVEIRAPFGDACWEGVTPQRLLLLGGGTGLAPMSSILEAALRAGQAPDSIHLYHGVRSSRDLYAAAQIRALSSQHGFRFVGAVANEPASSPLSQGHLHEVLAQDFIDLTDTAIFVAGPPPMVDAVRQLALQRGAQPEAIRADPFHAAEPEKKSLWGRITGFAGL